MKHLALVRDDERDDAETVTRRVAENPQVRVLAPRVDDVFRSRDLVLRDGVDVLRENFFLELEDEPGANVPKDVRRPAFFTRGHHGGVLVVNVVDVAHRATAWHRGLVRKKPLFRDEYARGTRSSGELVGGDEH